MLSRDRVINALTFKEYDKVPIEGSLCSNNDVSTPKINYGTGKSRGIPNKKGKYIDEWGCVWESGEDGVKGEVKKCIIDDWSALNQFKPPFDILNIDYSLVNKQCERTDKFMIFMWGTEPFQRMQFLRGTENLFMDLAYGDSEIYHLIDMVHEFYYKKLEYLVNTDVDGIHIEDDWGTQKSLLISPQMWREYFKPLYKDYCDLAHRKGKYVVMHSDGYIDQIIPDLIEIGVNAINAQIDCMNVDQLAEKYHEKICFWGGFDRQYLLPFGTPDEVRNEVRHIANAFFQYKRTGIVGQCFLDKDTNIHNFNALYDEWSKI